MWYVMRVQKIGKRRMHSTIPFSEPISALHNPDPILRTHPTQASLNPFVCM